MLTHLYDKDTGAHVIFSLDPEEDSFIILTEEGAAKGSITTLQECMNIKAEGFLSDTPFDPVTTIPGGRVTPVAPLLEMISEIRDREATKEDDNG